MKIITIAFVLLISSAIQTQAWTIRRLPTPILSDWNNKNKNNFDNSNKVIGIPRIIDGDTVHINETKMRLSGIDAPETDQLCLDAKGQKWACGASAKNELMKYAGERIWTCQIIKIDRYGRSLASCEANNEDIEKWMVRNGWALAYKHYSHKYDADEAAARDTQTGLWSGAFIAPWDWRHRNKKTVILGAASVPINAQEILLGAVSAQDAPSPTCSIKGNMKRNGECIYHEPGSRWYSKVNMDRGEGKRWFCSIQQAGAAGCRAAKN